VITDIEIKLKGMALLSEYLGDVEATRFIALMQREPFDYSLWRQEIDGDLDLREISRRAMVYRGELG